VATVNIAYGTSTSVTLTTTIATSTTAGRQSDAVTNTSNYDDALATLSVVSSSSAAASSKSVYIYIAASEDGTNYDADDAAIGASDAGYTINSPSNLKLAGAIYCPSTSKTYRKVFSVAATCGGVMPRKWVVVMINDTGQTIASGGGLTYTGITYTIA
jgi:hypothetical protein